MIRRLAPLPLLCACAVAAPDDALRAPVVLSPGVAVPVPEPEVWPTEDWAVAPPEELGLDPAALAELERYAFARNGDDQDRLGQRTNALLIVRHGKIAYEHYARDTRPDTPLLLWSVSKSVSNALVGAAVQQGRIDVNDAAADTFAPLKRGQHADIRITDLLRMSSGLAWSETYETSPLFSSVLAMLYSRGPNDMAGFAASFPLAHPPGTHWSYSSGDTNLAMAALHGAIGEAAWSDYPWTALFDPIGARDLTWERDAQGNFVGSSYVYASARNLAKVGLLFLQDGVWEGRRLLAEGWVRYSTSPAPSWANTDVLPDDIFDNPGASWYLNLGDASRDLPVPWPALPKDAFAAQGHWGKAMWVIPSWDMVVVRLGDDRQYACTRPEQTDCEPDREKAYHKQYFLEKVAACLR